MVLQHIRLHHIPAEGVAEHLHEGTGRGGPFLHHLPDVFGIQHGTARFHHRGLSRLLNPRGTRITQIVEIRARILAGDRTRGETQTAGEFVNVVERERSPAVRGARLHHRIGVGERRLEHSGDVFAPVAFGVQRPHVV